MVAVEGEEADDHAVLDRHPGGQLVGDHGGEMFAGVVVGVREAYVRERGVEGPQEDLGDRRAVVGAGGTDHHRTVRSRASWTSTVSPSRSLGWRS